MFFVLNYTFVSIKYKSTLAIHKLKYTGRHYSFNNFGLEC